MEWMKLVEEVIERGLEAEQRPELGIAKDREGKIYYVLRQAGKITEILRMMNDTEYHEYVTLGKVRLDKEKIDELLGRGENNGEN